MATQNEKLKVIGYGLGKVFAGYREQIEKLFDVIAWCDTNESRRLTVKPNISVKEIRTFAGGGMIRF